MNGPRSDFRTADDVEVGAARVALASLWCAVVTTHEVFAVPRFRFTSPEFVGNAAEAAAYLATQRPAGNCLQLAPVQWEGGLLEATITGIDGDERPGLGFADCLPDGGTRMLILAGGRGLRVSREMLEALDAGYRVAAHTSAGGSPPDHVWTVNFKLPPTWLDGVDFVMLLGTSRGNTASSPVRMGNGFDPDLIETL